MSSASQQGTNSPRFRRRWKVRLQLPHAESLIFDVLPLPTGKYEAWYIPFLSTGWIVPYLLQKVPRRAGSSWEVEVGSFMPRVRHLPITQPSVAQTY